MQRIADMLHGRAEHQLKRVNSGAVLAGQGGIGKTTLARHYAETRGGDYPGVLWAGAATRQDAISGLCAASAHLGLPVPDQPQVQHAQAVVTKIAQAARPWLIVFDNVEDRAAIDGLIPAGAHVIVTTRQGGGWEGWQALRAEVLAFDTPDAPAVQLLMDTAGRTDGANEARALAEVLGGLPLALVVMGAYLSEQALGFADGARQLTPVLRIVPQNAGYPQSLLGAVQLSYDRLSEDARIVAQLCSFWAAEGLGPRLLLDAPAGEQWTLAQDLILPVVQALLQDEGRVRAAFLDLGARSILTGTGEARAMHRMTASALRELESDALAPAAVALLAAVYPFDSDHSGNFDICARLTPHVRALLDSGAAPEVAAWQYLLNQAGVYLSAIADYTGCLPLAQEGLRVKQARGVPESDRVIALGHANLGAAHRRLGQWDRAEVELTRAVDLDREHRPGTADHADHLDLLGGLMVDLGRAGHPDGLNRAVKLYQLALAIRWRMVGRGTAPMAESLNNLGAVRDLQRRVTAAARLAGAALTIRRKVLRPDDSRLAESVLNVGISRLKFRRPDLAEPLLREALGIFEAAFAAQSQHHGRRSAADGLITCLLVRARAGVNRGLREAEAKTLCARYGLDFAEMQDKARQYPDPDGPAPWKTRSPRAGARAMV